jgi:hypothetical protein
MRQEVFVRFDPRSEFEIPVHGHAGLPADEARRWLDEQFIANDCEPLRASGKVLTADKVLALADGVGPQRFESDAPFATLCARRGRGAGAGGGARGREARALTY